MSFVIVNKQEDRRVNIDLRHKIKDLHIVIEGGKKSDPIDDKYRPNLMPFINAFGLEVEGSEKKPSSKKKAPAPKAEEPKVEEPKVEEAKEET